MKDHPMPANHTPTPFSKSGVTTAQPQPKVNVQILPIPLQLKVRVQESAQAPAYAVKTEQGWKTCTWGEYEKQILTVTRSLLYLGLEIEQSACILGNNCPEWLIFDVAVMLAASIPTGIYTSNSSQEVAYILQHSEARIILVEDLHQWKKVQSKIDQLPHLKHIILMPHAEVDPQQDLLYQAQASPNTLFWTDFLVLGESINQESIDARRSSIEGDQVATYIYTSGTTGPPKAVMLTHDNLSWTAQTAKDLVNFTRHDRIISYLPLSHIAEQMFSIYGPLTTGACVYFAESFITLADDLKTVKPTVFFAVPRVWEKIHTVLQQRIGKAQTFSKLLPTLQKIALESNQYKNKGKPLPLSLRMRYAVARSVLGKIKAALGLDQCRICVSGAAPIRLDILEFFASIDLRIHEVYGQSEGSGPSTFNFPNRTSYGSVGVRIPGIEIKIADDQEILVKGPNVFKGYFKDPQATAETLDQASYLHSGDLGRFDDKGFLHIIGRKKEIIITAGGKNIAPQNIEHAIAQHSWIQHVVVIGEAKPYLTALVTLDQEQIRSEMKSYDTDDMSTYVHIQKWIEETNQAFARVEQIKKFSILSKEFSVEGGELTPTLKLKRSVIEKKYQVTIEGLYQSQVS